MKYERLKHGGIYNVYNMGRGKQSCNVDCPFCGEKTKAFVWSLAGSGKKCKCGAILSMTEASKTIQTK